MISVLNRSDWLPANRRIVVADLDFVGGNGVVLVDDRDHAQAQQRQQRRAGIQVTVRSARSSCVSRICAVFSPCSRKQLSYACIQPHLPDCGGGP